MEVADEQAISPRPRKSQRAPIFAWSSGLRSMVLSVTGRLVVERDSHVQVVTQVLADAGQLVESPRRPRA